MLRPRSTETTRYQAHKVTVGAAEAAAPRFARYGVICGAQHIYYLGDALEVPEGRGRRPRP